jgi:hypothetical protein
MPLDVLRCGRDFFPASEHRTGSGTDLDARPYAGEKSVGRGFGVPFQWNIA